MTEEELFHAALAKPPAERAAFLDQACSGNAPLRAAVKALLAAHEAPGSLLNLPPNPPGAHPLEGDLAATLDSGVAAEREHAATGEHVSSSDGARDARPLQTATTDYRRDAVAGAVIGGRYTLQEKIGEGGMGEVWVAKQTVPVKRKVALKLIKTGMDSRAVLQRFEHERQALALMDHPHIARVLDGGMTPTGQPFFVMELVNGLPLNKFCDELKLTLQQRLELFVPICQAVQHAHQKGIVHRDLKPANILVTMIDGKPVPKVIDFGVAKATSGKLTEETMSTGFGAVVGTLEYMSPEQAGFSGEDIDTRADIYSLGVILYELLTGLRPIDAKRLRKAALTEMIRIIREEEPSKPSTRLSTDESLPSLAAVRQIEPRKLTALLRGELDWVVMKCLEKQRDRRYETANGLARDIQRYLADEAVEARPPSTGYRLKKFVKRNKGQVIAASLVLLALVAGIVGTTWQAVRAERARANEADQRAIAEDNERKAKTEQARAERAAAAEKLARQDEQRERTFAEAIARFVKDDFLGLTSVEGQDRFGGDFGSEGLDRNATLMSLLDRAATKLKARQDLDPRIEAELCWIVGVNYRGAGEAAKGVPFLERAAELRRSALGIGHVETLDAMNSLAVCYNAAGQRDKALPLHEQTLKLQQVNLGVDHPHTINTMRSLAGCYEDAGQLDRSFPLFEQTLELSQKALGPNHLQTLNCMNDLAVSYSVAQQYEKALPLFEQSLTTKRLVHGEDHLSTIRAIANLADCYRVTGQVQKALPMLEQCFERFQEKLGPRHPQTVDSMHKLAIGYQSAGQLQKALPLLEQRYELDKEKLGPYHPHTLQVMGNLAGSYSQAGQLEKAIPLFELTLELQKKHVGADHLDTITTMNNLAQQGYHAAGQFDKSVPLQEAALEAVKRKRGPDHPHTLSSMTNLAADYLAVGKVEQAVPLYEQALQAARVTSSVDDRYILGVIRKLAEVYRDTGQLDKALPLLEEFFMLSKAKFGPDHLNTVSSMNDLAFCYWSLKRLDKSVPLFEELLPLREKTLGRNDKDTLIAVANLGVNYKDAGRVAEAIPLLAEAYRASKKLPSLDSIGPILVDAYVQAGKPAEAAKLVEELVADARKQLPKDGQQLAGMLAQCGSILLETKTYAEAESLLREALDIREKTQPDAWTTFNSQSMLGGALLGQKKFADAEPLLLKGYEGMKQREQTIPPQGVIRLPQALDRLIEFYTATDKPEEVRKWQAERAKYPPATAAATDNK